MSTPSGTRALLVEDDAVIGAELERGLAGAGMEIVWCRLGRPALHGTVGQGADVVVLDLGLPDVDGIEVARALRARHRDVLLLILTARDDDIDVIVGLDAGADDYLVKPVSVTVLLARIRAHLRRRPDPSGEASTLTAGDLLLDLRGRRCTVAGTEVGLRIKEFDLLATLLATPGVAVSREDLMARVWDENWFGPTKTLDVTMASLRARLVTAGQEAADRTIPVRPVRMPRITTLRGFGYRLDTDDVQ